MDTTIDEDDDYDDVDSVLAENWWYGALNANDAILAASVMEKTWMDRLCGLDINGLEGHEHLYHLFPLNRAIYYMRVMKVSL